MLTICFFFFGLISFVTANTTDGGIITTLSAGLGIWFLFLTALCGGLELKSRLKRPRSVRLGSMTFQPLPMLGGRRFGR